MAASWRTYAQPTFLGMPSVDFPPHAAAIALCCFLETLGMVALSLAWSLPRLPPGRLSPA